MDSQIQTIRVTIQPGGFSGWHSHPGITIVSVIAGTWTSYDGSDRTCSPSVHPAGSAFVETIDSAHPAFIRNEGTVPLVFLATHIVPADHVGPTRLDEANPGNCPF